MRIKQRIDDFRVRELLVEGFLQQRGEHRVYRVTKRKLTSLDAARELAYVAGVPASEVALAGLKDRQGVTTQYMTIRRGREVSLRALDLSVESVGFAVDAIASQQSLGNAFEVTLRGLSQEELDVLRDNVPALRESGVVNYFDEQRFGNLRHNQGWIAQQLMRGEHEAALKRLLASLSDHDDRAAQAFKTALLSSWGDWSACREIAGRFHQHHSVFEYLKDNEDDFAGAFYHVSSRLRLIHLYSFQSHVWNRAVADYVRGLVPLEERVVLEGLEGPLVYPSKPLPLPEGATFRLPGPGLEDVRDPIQRGMLEDALSRERMVAADFRIEGVSGFQLKGEDRELVIQPRHLRVRPPERDALNFGAFAVKVRFELPRGAYATLVVRRLLSSPIRSAGRERGADRGQRDTRQQLAGSTHGGADREAFRSEHRAQHTGSDRAGRSDRGDRGERPHGGERGRQDSSARPYRRAPPPEHRESGESLAPPRRDSYGRGERGFRDRGRGDDRGRSEQRGYGDRGAERQGERPFYGSRPREGSGAPRGFQSDRGFERGGNWRGERPHGGGQAPGQGFERSGSSHGDRPYGQGQRGGQGFERSGSSHGDRPYGQGPRGGQEFERGGSDRGERPYGQGQRSGQGFGRGGSSRGDRPFGQGHFGGHGGERASGERGQGHFARPGRSGGGSYDDRRPWNEPRSGDADRSGGDRGGWQPRPPRGDWSPSSGQGRPGGDRARGGGQRPWQGGRDSGGRGGRARPFGSDQGGFARDARSSQERRETPPPRVEPPPPENE